MKNTLFTLLFALFYYAAQSQSYIWTKKEKLPIRFHPTVVTLKYASDLQLKDIARKLEIDEKLILKVERTHSKIYRVDLIEEYKNKIDDVIPAVTVNGDQPILMTGEISVMPKAKTDINFIIKKYSLKLIEKTNYGAYLLAVPNPSKTLSIANEIHEREEVSYATPDFIMNAKTFNDPLYPVNTI